MTTSETTTRVSQPTSAAADVRGGLTTAGNLLRIARDTNAVLAQLAAVLVDGPTVHVIRPAN